MKKKPSIRKTYVSLCETSFPCLLCRVIFYYGRIYNSIDILMYDGRMKKRRWTRPVRCIVARLLRIIILLLFMRTAAAPTTMTTREESARDFHWNDSEKGREKKKKYETKLGITSLEFLIIYPNTYRAEQSQCITILEYIIIIRMAMTRACRRRKKKMRKKGGKNNKKSAHKRRRFRHLHAPSSPARAFVQHSFGQSYDYLFFLIRFPAGKK